MRILILHQFYLMPGMPGGSRFNELARLFAAAGHEVTVIAGNLDYASGKRPAKYRWRWNTRERDDAVDVIRCHVPETYNQSYAGRAWAFVAFALSAGSATLLQRRHDVVIATSPPLTIAASGLLAALWHRAPWVFEVRDLWPESAVSTGVLSRNGLLTRALYGIERLACRTATKINVLTPAFAEDMERRGLAKADKMVFVPNGVDPEALSPGPRDNGFRREMGWGDRTVVLYAGAHGRANALMQLVDTAQLLVERPDILIACVGDGPEKARVVAAARERKLANISFHPAQAKDGMADVINASDIGIAVLQDNPTFRTVYPNKVFDYMACAKPVLLAIDGAARRIVVDEARAGIYAKAEDAPALAAATITLVDDPDSRQAMGERGRVWVVANVGRQGLAARYLQILQDLVDSRR